MAGKSVAAFYIVLMLSMHPIQAMRQKTQVDQVKAYSEMAELMAELQKAHDEDMEEVALKERKERGNLTKEDEGYLFEWWSGCPARKEDLDRRIEKTRLRYEDAMSDGELTTFEGAWIILKARSVIKTMDAARECPWMKHDFSETGEINKVDLKALFQGVAKDNKCLPAAEKYLEDAASLSPDEQQRAVLNSLGIVMSDDCKVPQVKSRNVNVEFALNQAEKKVDNVAETLEDELIDKEIEMEKEAKKAEHAMLLETGRVNVTREDDTMAAKKNIKASLAEMVKKLESGNPIAEFFGKLIGIIILGLLFIIICYVGLFILMLIIGLIACLIKLLIVAFMRLFGSQKWDFDYFGCVGFWLGIFGHSSGHGGFEISLCAASMLTGMWH